MILLFVFAFLILACWIAYAGGRRPERWRRWLAIAVATSLPLQIFLVMWVRDILMPGYDPTSENARFGFYAGLGIANRVTPIWFVAAVIAGRAGARLRPDHPTSDDAMGDTA